MTNRYTVCMTQLVARVEDDLLTAVDDLVASGQVSSRSDAVRRALRALIESYRRQEVGRQIVEGYTRQPQDEQEMGWADAATVAMIAEEPW